MERKIKANDLTLSELFKNLGGASKVYSAAVRKSKVPFENFSLKKED